MQRLRELPSLSLRFTAKLISTGEPLLLSARLYQLGAIEVLKFTPQQTSLVELTPSVVVKVTAYRDELQAAWDELIKAPVKAIMDAMPQLKTCRQIGCQCPQWHGVSSPGEPQAILEIWGRAFLKSSGKPELPPSAGLFAVYLRLPASYSANPDCVRCSWGLRGA